MIKKLSKHGNSLALIIDKPILELLDANTDTEFDISTDGKRLFIAPIRVDEIKEEEMKDFLVDFNARYPNAMKKLAE